MNLEELGRRAVACKHWRWMPGMLAMDVGGNRWHVVDCDARSAKVFAAIRDYDDMVVDASNVPAAALTPDLTDPATLGCLLHLVREAWGEQIEVFAYRTEMHDKRWCIERIGSERDQSLAWYGWTEAEALVAALEAAP